MSTQRGKRFRDVLGRKVWTSLELQDMPLASPTPELYLAIMLFLSRYAANTRAFVFVDGETDDGGPQGERGCG